MEQKGFQDFGAKREAKSQPEASAFFYGPGKAVLFREHCSRTQGTGISGCGGKRSVLIPVVTIIVHGE